MNFTLPKHHRILFFIAWFLINLVQAGTTGLFDDEAYYWVYSKHLDWGYFDHPPMIAMLIKMGYRLFQNEFGVRLFTVILSVLSLVIVHYLLPRKNDLLFYAIACSFAVLQIGGFIAVPDLPMAFFVSLFFLVYKKFLIKETWPRVLLLGLVMALMLYSKYHGVLIILFTILSNPRLLVNRRFYAAALTGALLFLPHLFWQYQHGFPSVEYHLFERNASEYKFRYTTEYVLGQILLPGPLIGWLFLWSAFAYRTRDAFEKALKFSMIGIYIFFLISTLKGRVEANWTVPVFIPVIVLSHQYLLDKKQWQTFLFRSVPVTLLLVFMARLYIMLDFEPLRLLRKDEFHRNQPWADSIHKRTGGLPIVFINSYQKASKYWFYAGSPSLSLNTVIYRRNNYNFLPVEDSFYGKRVAVVSSDTDKYFKDSISTPKGIAGMTIIDTFYSFTKVKIFADKQVVVENGFAANCRFETAVEDNHIKAFQNKRFQSNTIELIVIRGNEILARISTNVLLPAIRRERQTFVTGFPVNLPKGEYAARYSLPTSLAPHPSLNSMTLKLIVR